MDEAIAAMRRVVEVEHRYRPAALSSYEAVEYRFCECGDGFLSAEAHRSHVYAKAVEEAVRSAGTYEYATLARPEWGIDSVKTMRPNRDVAVRNVQNPRASGRAVVRRPVLRLEWEVDDAD